MSRVRLALAVVSHSSQVRAVDRAMRSHGASNVVLVSENRLPKKGIPSGVRMQVFSDYVSKRESRSLHRCKLMKCGLIADEIVKDAAAGDTHLAMLLGCLMPEFQTRHVDLILRSILAISRALEAERPEEVWITATSRWSSPGVPRFPGSEPSPLDYSAVLTTIAARVAALNLVPIRWLPATLSEVICYGAARWLRPHLETVSQMVYWLRKASARWTRLSGESGPDKAGICFFVQARVHGERLSPVASLIGDKRSIFFRDRSLSGSSAKVDLGTYDYPFVDFYGFVSQIARSRQYQRQVHRNVKERGFSERKDVFRYLGVYFGDLLEESFYAYLGLLPDVLAYANSASQAVKWLEPTVWVMAHPRSRACQAILRICHRNQIPTLVVQHGFTSPLDYSVPVFASRIAVMGKQTADILESYGVPNLRISVTGVAVDKGSDRGRYSAGTGSGSCVQLRTGYPTVLVASNPDLASDPSADYAEQVSRQLGVNVILKLHPLASAAQYREYFRTRYSGSDVKIIQDIDFASLLSVSDVLVGGESTTVIEAMSSGVPAILNESAFESVYTDYAWCATSPAECVLMVRRVLPGGIDRNAYVEWQRSSATDFIMDTEGASRIVDVIDYLSRGSWGPDLDTPTSFCPSGGCSRGVAVR